MAAGSSIEELVRMALARGEGEGPGLGAEPSPSPTLPLGGDPGFVAGSPPETGSETVMDLGAGSIAGPDTEEEAGFSDFARDFGGPGPPDPSANGF